MHGRSKRKKKHYDIRKLQVCIVIQQTRGQSVLYLKNCITINTPETHKNLFSLNLRSTEHALALNANFGFATHFLWRILYPIFHTYASKTRGTFSFQKYVFTCLTFIRPQVFNTDPAPCGAVVKELDVDTGGFPFPSDDGSFGRMVVYETRPPRVTFHLGPDQVTRRIITGDATKTTDIELNEHLTF